MTAPKRTMPFLPTSLLALLLLATPTTAKPFTLDHTTTLTLLESPANSEDAPKTKLLAQRGCASPCGYYGQVCCQSGETCTTDANNEAQCVAAGGGSGQVTGTAGGPGYWQYFTSTYVETDLVTKTTVYSSYIGGGGGGGAAYSPTAPAGATATAAAAQCDWSGGESSCGNICCAAGQYCQVSGQCSPAAGGSVSAPLRPTMSGSYTVQTQTQYSTTTTQPFIAPIATGQQAGVNITSTQPDNGGGLSGGAIAGIVIGVLAGILLLGLLILFCCIRGVWRTFFGGGRTNRRGETIVEESYHRSRGGGTAGGRSNARWGVGPSGGGSRRVVEEKRTTRKGFLPAMAGVGTIFGANRVRKERQERRRRDKESDVSSTFYSSDYTASSSDRRTRDTRRL